jgi:hypothetical protein
MGQTMTDDTLAGGHNLGVAVPSTWQDGGDRWNTPGDWGGGEPTSTTDVVVTQGDPEATSAFTVKSITDFAAITFANAGVSSVTGAVTNSGALSFDQSSGAGGSGLTVGG